MVAKETGRQKVHFMGAVVRRVARGTLCDDRTEHCVPPGAGGAFTYKGTESPRLKRAEQLRYFRTHNMRKARSRHDRGYFHTRQTRDHRPWRSGKILADVELHRRAGTGTYLDMTANLPVRLIQEVWLLSKLSSPRRRYDGIATVEDLFDFYGSFPHGDSSW